MSTAIDTSKLTVRSVVASVQSGTVTAEQVTTAFLQRISEQEESVGAFTHFDPYPVLEAARQLDTSGSKGALAAVPLGVKDIIDTVNMPTCYGSEAYSGTRPVWDAPSVCLSKHAGALIIGKTVSTEFALVAPGKTRNPWNPEHTPGGSSSGSAAAVAAGMVLAAFATQTSGSLIRPAAFCGVVGYKPSYGVMDRTGIKVLSDSLDTLGVMTRNVRDAAYLVSILTDRPTLTVNAAPRVPIVGLVDATDPNLEEGSRLALERTEKALRGKGARVAFLTPPRWFADLPAMLDLLMGWEVTRSLSYERLCLGDRISTLTRAFMDQLASVTLTDYLDVKERLVQISTELDNLWSDCDVIVAPSAAGEAPASLNSTGNPAFNKSWTLLRAPAVNVPAGFGPNGLPVGVQVVGRPGDDVRTLSAAAYIEDVLPVIGRADAATAAAPSSI